MSHIRFFSLLCIIFFCAACSDDDKDPIGSIMFTSDRDCDIRLFNSKGDQVAHEQYEAAKPPAIVNLKYTGVYVVRAVSGNDECKEPIAYGGGNIEYYIEF